MTARKSAFARASEKAASFRAARSGASAVEFAIVAFPAILIVLCMIQIGLFYMAQTSLDAGVVRTADALINTFNSGTAPAIPTASSLKSQVVANSGGMVRNDSTLSVEMRKLTALTGAAVPIGNTIDSSAPMDVLVLRAQASVITFVPGFQALATIRSSAIVRRQAL